MANLYKILVDSKSCHGGNLTMTAIIFYQEIPDKTFVLLAEGHASKIEQLRTVHECYINTGLATKQEEIVNVIQHRLCVILNRKEDTNWLEENFSNKIEEFSDCSFDLISNVEGEEKENAPVLRLSGDVAIVVTGFVL